MDKDLPISQKRGFKTNSIECILVKADVNSISQLFSEYFGLKVYSNCNPEKYAKLYIIFHKKQLKLESILLRLSGNQRNKIENKLKNLSCPVSIWKFYNHSWSIVSFKGNQYDIAFACSALLNTDVITYWIPKHDDCNELKLFRGDKLVEHYIFGSECGKACDNYWDVIIELQLHFKLESHRFCSSIRQLTETEIKQAVKRKLISSDDSDFLNDCLKYYEAYFPIEEETPFNYVYPRNNSALQKFSDALEQIDIVMIPNNWNYYDRNVPQQVIKN